MRVSLVKRPKPQGTIWVCYDCLHAAVNGEVSDDRPADLPEPWALEMGTDVTPGLTWSEHNDPTGCEATFRDGSDQCSCETREIASSRCDGCGDWHAGSRHAFTYWG